MPPSSLHKISLSCAPPLFSSENLCVHHFHGGSTCDPQGRLRRLFSPQCQCNYDFAHGANSLRVKFRRVLLVSAARSPLAMELGAPFKWRHQIESMWRCGALSRHYQIMASQALTTARLMRFACQSAFTFLRLSARRFCSGSRCLIGVPKLQILLHACGGSMVLAGLNESPALNSI